VVHVRWKSDGVRSGEVASRARRCEGAESTTRSVSASVRARCWTHMRLVMDPGFNASACRESLGLIAAYRLLRSPITFRRHLSRTRCLGQYEVHARADA
jgi:hypothetical protein